MSSFSRLEQPINWSRAFFSGVIGACILMFFIDIFAMMGLTPFSLEIYTGTLLRGTMEFMPRAWPVGFIFNCALGGVFGILYGYFFEYFFFRSGGRLGAMMGVVHTLIVGVAVLPFFETIRDQMGIPMFPEGLGFLGSSLGVVTPLVIFVGHLLFGASMGLFYGPVRSERIRTRNFEPGEVGYPGDPDVITEEEDPIGATPTVPYHAPGSAFRRRRRKSA